MSLENFKYKSRNEFPSLNDLETSFNSLSPDSAYFSLAESSMEQIKLFERNKVTGNNQEEFIVSILSSLAPGQVSLAKLGSVSRGIQRVYTSLVNDVFGKGNSKGLIPKHIIDSSQLIMAYNSPGSFNMHLDVKDDHFVDGAISNESIEKLKEFLFRLPQEDPSFIIEEFGYRTFAVSKNWFKEMDKEEISLSIIDKTKQSKIDKETVHRISMKFDEIKNKVETESISVVGIIDSANRSVNSLKIISDTGNAVSVKTTHELFKKGLVIATKKYKFDLDKNTILNTATGKTKELYVLNDVTDI